MRKAQLLLVGLLAMASTAMAAVPQGHSSVTVAPAAVVSTSNATSTAPAATPLTLADVLAPSTPGATACNLLCIQGDHCCVVKKQATCIPNDQACPKG